jgi:hypothetical protein
MGSYVGTLEKCSAYQIGVEEAVRSGLTRRRRNSGGCTNRIDDDRGSAVQQRLRWCGICSSKMISNLLVAARRSWRRGNLVAAAPYAAQNPSYG